MEVKPSPLALPFPGQTNPAPSAVLTCHVLQPLVHLGGPQLDLLQYVNVPELDTVFQMWSHKCWIEGNNNFLWVAAYFLNKAAQYEAGFYCCKGILLTHVQFSLQESQVLFVKLLSNQLAPRLSQMQDSVFAFITHHDFRYNFRYKCSFFKHNAWLQIEWPVCTCVHQVYRHILLTFYSQSSLIF